MFKSFRDKVALSGVAVLMIGVILLIFTFISAYGFLTQSLSIIASNDLVKTFGEALAPLIATGIRIMYLGVMGWVASLLTIRGVTIIVNAPKVEQAVPTSQKPPVAVPQAKPAPPQKEKEKAEPQKEPPKPEAKPEVKPEVKPEPKPAEPPKAPEPEIIVIPPEQIVQPPPAQNEQQKNGSQSQSNGQ